MGSLHGAISGVISGLGVYVSDVWATPCSHVGQLKTCSWPWTLQALGSWDVRGCGLLRKRWRGKQCLVASKQAYGAEANFPLG